MKPEQNLFGKSSNWRLHLLDDDPVGLIGTCKCITIRVEWNFAIAEAETDPYFPSSNATTVSFDISGSMNVNVYALIQCTVNGGRICALCVVERKVPSLTASCTALDANITHVNHTKV